MRYLHPFGCLCFMKIVDQNVRLDFDQKAVACYYLGYDFRKKSFVLLDLSNKRVRWSANVKFCDNVWNKEKIEYLDLNTFFEPYHHYLKMNDIYVFYL